MKEREREKERLLDEKGKEERERESPKQGEREGRSYTVVKVTAPEPWLPYNTGPAGSSEDMT